MYTLTPMQIAWRLAQDLPEGSVVKLGPGYPALVQDFLTQAHKVVIYPDADTPGIGSGQHPSSEAECRGAGLVSTVENINIDICVLGADQVTGQGELVCQPLAQHGCERDLAGTAKRVLVMMELFAKDGSCKLLSASTLPLTGLEVSSVYTDLAVFDFHHGQLTLREIVEGITLRVLQAEIDTDFLVSPHLQLLQAPKLA